MPHIWTQVPKGLNIAISGKLGSAKTTCSDLLLQRLEYNKMSLATPLKKLLQQVRTQQWCAMAQDLAQYPYENDKDPIDNANESIDNIVGYLIAHHDDRDLWGGKGRKFLQIIGTNWFRRQYPGIWCRIFERHATGHVKIVGKGAVEVTSKVLLGPVVCDDLRFPDELEMFRRLGFITLRCNLPEDVRISRIAESDKDYIYHPSETALDAVPLDQFDGVIDTSCPLDQQEEKLVEAIMAAVNNPKRACE